MLGYDISWAAFNIIEVMSSHKFTYKRIGYLAASQCFNENTDVLMLTTNMIKKVIILAIQIVTRVLGSREISGFKQPKSVWCWDSPHRSRMFHHARFSEGFSQWPCNLGKFLSVYYGELLAC